MEIKINLPSNSSINTYKELNGYLKQLELAIHHAQKAVQNAENTGIKITEDAFVCFEHPSLDNLKIDSEDVKFDGQNFYEELQNIVLGINLQ